MKKSRKIILILMNVAVILLSLFTALMSLYYYAIDKAFVMMTNAISDGQVELYAAESAPPSEGGEQGEAQPAEPMDEKMANVAKLLSEMTPEKAQRLQEAVTPADKEAVIKVLINALPPNEYMRIASMLEGGITQEELREAMTILRTYLTREEKDQILYYYGKYVHILQEP